MMRFAWVTMASAVLLAGCGGGLSSPDFKGDLVGFDIVYPNSTSPTAQARTAPGTTFQFSAVGLYSLPPGTSATTPNTRSCPSASDPSRVCRQGEINGVTWSVDPTGTVNGQPLATINADGLATGLRRGYAQVRARAAGFPDVTEQLIVNGPVIQAINVAVVNAKFGTTFTPPGVPKVPTGRSFALTGTASCDRGFTGGEATGDGPVAASPNNCVNGANASYQFNWSLGDTTNPGAGDFSPASGVGKSILLKTKQLGPFEALARFTNEEGVEVRTSVALEAGPRVLDDILVSSDPAQTAPVSVLLKAKTRFIARGLFSDGAVDVIRPGDLQTDTQLVWSEDASPVGDVTIENSAAAPNSAVLVTGVITGATGLIVKGFNNENEGKADPTGLELEDRIAVIVRSAGLRALADICPFVSSGTECLQNRQLPRGVDVKFKARGFFDDNPNTPRDIDPQQIPLVWSVTETPTGGRATAITTGTAPNIVTTGEIRGTAQGPVTINVELADDTVEPAATTREISTAATVVEALCADQFLTSNGATGAGSSAEVSNIGNVLDSNPDTPGVITVTGEGLLLPGSEETMSIRRDATSVVPPVAGYNIGFLVSFDEEFVNPESIMSVQTLGADGAVIQGNASGQLAVTASNTGTNRVVGSGTRTVWAIKARATQPFAGIRLRVVGPASAPPSSPDPSALTALLDLLIGGGETDVQVWGACAQFTN